MADYAYHSRDALEKLGERVRDKAIKVTLDQEASFARAQQQANNDASRYDNGQPTQSQNYTPVRRGRADDEANLKSYVSGAYAGLPRLFTQFAVPDPANTQPALDALYRSAVTVEPSLQIKSDGGRLTTPLQVGDEPGSVPVEETVNIITTHTKQWDGDAADAFDIYVKSLQISARHHREIALSLAAGLEAQSAIRRAQLTDIWDIGNKTLDALGELEGFCPGQREAKVQAALTIGGAIAAVVFVSATTGGTGTAVAVAASVEGLQSAAAIMGAVPALTSKETIAGMTVPPILEGMANAITKLSQRLDQQQKEVSRAMIAVNDSLDAIWKRALVPAPEKLTDLSDADRSTLETKTGFFAR